PYFQQSRAAVVLCKPDLAQVSGGPACRVLVRDPHVALLSVIPVLYPEPSWNAGIHPTAVIGRGVVWTEPVAIGPYAVLGEGARLGQRVRVGAACVLGDGVQVGDDVRLHPQVVCYSGTIIGNRVILHAGARLGSDGFGYIPGRGGRPRDGAGGRHRRYRPWGDGVGVSGPQPPRVPARPGGAVPAGADRGRPRSAGAAQGGAPSVDGRCGNGRRCRGADCTRVPRPRRRSCLRRRA